MSKFIFKPEYIDFGTEPCSKTIPFIHECASITVVSKPVWIDNITINYSAYVSGSPLTGTLTASVSSDTAFRSTSAIITLACDAETKYIPANIS